MSGSISLTGLSHFPGQAAAPQSQPARGTRLRLAAEPGVSADPAGLTARTRPWAKPETRAANPRNELGIYPQDTDRRRARVRCKELQITPSREDPGQPANRNVAAEIRRGYEGPIEPIVSIGIAQAVEAFHWLAYHLLHTPYA